MSGVLGYLSHKVYGVQVGRTKIITLHSSIWAVNSTDRTLQLRLHIPISPLSAPQSDGTGSDANAGRKHPGHGNADADTSIGPLAPGKGSHFRMCT